MDEAFYYYYELYDEEMLEIYYDIMDGSSQQFWDVVPKTLLFKVWNDFMKYGFVRNEKQLQKIKNLIIENAIKIDCNSEYCGHKSDDVIQKMSDMLELSDKEGEYFEDIFLNSLDIYFFDDSGADRISDYILDDLRELIFLLLQSTDPKEDIVLIDRVLNLIHRRGDVAAWFIEGGEDTLSELSGGQ